jgi:hypothetical protein
VDAANLPKFAFGVDLTLTNPFYVKAETLKLHASADADPNATPATGLNFQSSLGFLSVSVVDGSLAFDADITVDLSVLSGLDDKITTDEFLSNLALLSPSPGPTTPLPISLLPGLMVATRIPHSSLAQRRFRRPTSSTRPPQVRLRSLFQPTPSILATSTPPTLSA